MASAERLVSDRETSVRESESRLAEREKEARTARAHRDGLARDASRSSKAEAATALAEAERQKKSAASAAEQSRQSSPGPLLRGVKEETRRTSRPVCRAEEDKFKKAVAQRKAEEVRLADARTERARLDEERSKLEHERAELETARTPCSPRSIHSRRQRCAGGGQTGRHQRIPPRLGPARATVGTGRQRDCHAASARDTLVCRAKGQANAGSQGSGGPVTVRSQHATFPRAKHAVPGGEQADPEQRQPASLGHAASAQPHPQHRFVDEPSRASVIIDIDDSATLLRRAPGGRRLSLRIEHSELPESLARNLDATEYLGPVKIISSYRDPRRAQHRARGRGSGRGRPQSGSLDGNRIFWDFQKAPAQAPESAARR